ncbi:YjjG family noncanonical pyrimidine nucleotidase [Enterococcus mundtii]|uniref:YjjG family noncanonical pyrimidine nucleotidase n=1 Tax=Enterococcus mundtii TaxID=53346 RepID=UPI0010BEC4EC|nr:YjjG family noncanonical pyrimidine nucleotidase [Enterococcus mundtii]QCJ55287.1 noncanonical pyrimidine nucleotidase, YjjG family [Enterococcus mundtii]
MKYHTLLFDVDDTLLDFQQTETEALHQLFAEQGIELTPEIRTSYKALNHHLWREFEKGQMTRDEVTGNRFGLLFQQFGKTVDSQAMDQRYRHYLNQGHHWIPGSHELLEAVSIEAELYIVTNGVSQTQHQRLTDARMIHYFREIFVSEAIGAQKPMKAFFDHVFANIPELDKERTVIIGDSLTSDIKGGNEAGIDTIWFNKNKLPEIPEIQPTYRIDSLEELYPLLEISPH